MIDFDEPFNRLLTQGMVLKDGEVMSKSKGNIVDPDSIIKKYGADALRLFILFAAPPETELEWDDRGIEGAFKFLNRVWRIQENLKEKADEGLLRDMHKAVKKVTEDIQDFKFNTAIAGLMELTNAIYQFGADKEVFKNLVLMLSPIAPHFCEELWQILGNKESISKSEWPKYDSAMLIEETVTVVIQVNGKVRSKIDVPADITEAKLKEFVLADEKLKPWLQGKPIKNFIVVPKKLINLVL
jgi:leucyl-tRNA synthetase